MKTSLKLSLLALAMPFAIAAAQAQLANSETTSRKDTTVKTDTSRSAAAVWTLAPTIVIQNFRPADQRGLNLFEAPKDQGIPFTGFRYSVGASFRQQFQGLEHSNKATAVNVTTNGVTSNANQLIDIGRGFNLADANLNLNMQLADGIRVALTGYMASKHHQEFWVKDGYALIDKSPIDNPILNNIMKYTTLKLGHFETNYGDQHFRRSDNGNGLYNPFVGNLIIDAFTTEVGGEVYFRAKGALAMAGLNSGTISGGVTAPDKRTNAYVGKLGYDRQLTQDLRVRLTGSYYKNDKSTSNTLLTGDRAGGPYDLVMENTAASLTTNAWSGQMRSMGFSNSLRAYGFNPFVKFQGFEFFGTYDNFKGKSNATVASTGALQDPLWRSWTQLAGEGVYRFWNEKLYVGARANTAKGQLLSTTGATAVTYTGDVGIQRNALSAGWFVTPVMLLKGEYMRQDFYRFPARDIRSGGKIQGFVMEGIVSF